MHESTQSTYVRTIEVGRGQLKVKYFGKCSDEGEKIK